MQRERGFTLIELLIVVAIIGVLAAIAIPNLIAAMNRARQKRTMADIRNVAMAWESRAVDVGTYAPAAAGITLCCAVPVTYPEIGDMLVPAYIKDIPQRDSWGTSLEFAVDGSGDAYLIRSYGRGGQRDSDVAGGATSQFSCDIVYSIGAFVQYPDGVQTQ